MPRFHPLEVTDVRRETRDAVVVTLKPRDEDAENFGFTQGQYLTFRRAFDGEELRRSYSICAGVGEGCLKVGIKRVDGGAFSTWANEELKPGDTLDAMVPQGRFFTVLDASSAKNYLGFAGGSGITPVLSIIKTVLAHEPNATFTLVYANRQVGSIMFREELEDLRGRIGLYGIEDRRIRQSAPESVEILFHHIEVDDEAGAVDTSVGEEIDDALSGHVALP